MKPLTVEINNRSNRLAGPETATRAIFASLDASGKFPIEGGELSIVFVNDNEIAQIHGDFMDDPTPTDVITFPSDPEMDSAGEIIVSVDQARRKATELNVPFSHELCLYLVHGWLHLAGYDDRSEEDRVAMRKAEEEALEVLKVDRALDDFVEKTPPFRSPI